MKATSEPRVTRRPKYVNESGTVLTLVDVEVQPLVGAGIFLFSVEREREITFLTAKGTLDAPQLELLSLKAHAFAKFPPTVHDGSRLTLCRIPRKRREKPYLATAITAKVTERQMIVERLN